MKSLKVLLTLTEGNDTSSKVFREYKDTENK